MSGGKYFLGCLAFSISIAGFAWGTGNAAAEGDEPLYVSPISDDMNVSVVENHIIIDRPAKQVFDFISTPANTARWFPQMQSWEVVRGGPADKPQKLGDVTLESIAPIKPEFIELLKKAGVSNPNIPVGFKQPKHQYTVVALVPGQQWVAAGREVDGDGQPKDRISTIADWSVKPLTNGKSMFIRIFTVIKPNAHNPGSLTGSQSAAVMQPGLVALKEMIERELPKK
jgi:hypothetical protein